MLSESSKQPKHLHEGGTPEATLTNKPRALKDQLEARGVKVSVEKNKDAVPVGTESLKYEFSGIVDLSHLSPQDLPQLCTVTGRLILSRDFIEKLRGDMSFRSFDFNCPISIVGVSNLGKEEREALLRELWEANGVSAPGPEMIEFI